MSRIISTIVITALLLSLSANTLPLHNAAVPSAIYGWSNTNACILIIPNNTNPLWQDSATVANQASIVMRPSGYYVYLYANNNCESPGGTINRVKFD